MSEQATSVAPILTRASSTRAVRVLVAVEDASVARHVTTALDGDRFVLYTAAEQPIVPPEVVVTDQTIASSALAPYHELLLHGTVGVLVIGRALPADVVLPQEFTRREMRLACRMLAQVVALRGQNHRLRELSQTDPLTGLPNRRALEDHFTTLARAPSGEPVALAILDLDNFKQINEHLGYVRGDDVLRAAAKTLSVRGGGKFVARLGGDEFALLWSTPDDGELLSVVDELRRALGTATSLKSERPVSASAGIARLASGHDFTALLTAADAALRSAKAAGGKRTEG